MMRVFVYGTLMPGEENFAPYCAEAVVDWCEAIALGHLYDLPLGYPALTVGDQWVEGVLLTFTDPQILERLDALEEYDPTRSPAENEYMREWIEVFDRQGRSLGWAWVYRMTVAQALAWGGTRWSEGRWRRSTP